MAFQLENELYSITALLEVAMNKIALGIVPLEIIGQPYERPLLVIHIAFVQMIEQLNKW